MVSDSAWLGLKNYAAIDAIQGFDHTLDLGSCRRRVTTSCTNYDDHVPITMYEEIARRGRTTSTLIVATGYNDSDHNFVSDFQLIVELTRSLGYERVVWLTLRDNVTYRSPDGFGFGEVFANNNATLKALVASGDFPEVTVADWSTYANSHSEWFAADGIHVRRAGPWAAADYISRKMAFLDRRPCARPLASGQPVQDPCPDPDLTGLQAELESLYPSRRPVPSRSVLHRVGRSEQLAERSMVGDVGLDHCLVDPMKPLTVRVAVRKVAHQTAHHRATSRA